MPFKYFSNIFFVHAFCNLDCVRWELNGTDPADKEQRSRLLSFRSTMLFSFLLSNIGLFSLYQLYMSHNHWVASRHGWVSSDGPAFMDDVYLQGTLYLTVGVFGFQLFGATFYIFQKPWLALFRGPVKRDLQNL